MNENTRPLMVSIWCITYNHEPYIRQCLEGFVMQKTNFRFEAIVHDDASTDGTAAIVREYAEKYPNIIKPILETENQYSKQDGSLDRIMNEKCTGKYIALCEGDDYWIDPLKLQKQVDFMEKHLDYSMCFHNAIKYKVQSNEIELFNHFIDDHDLSIHDAIHDWLVPTASILVRREFIYTPDWMARIYSGDYSLILRALNGGKIYGFKAFMSLYRYNIGNDSASARMKDKVIFVFEQENELLRSFDKGSRGLFSEEITAKIIENQKFINYAKRKQHGLVFCLFDGYFYKRLHQKIREYLIKALED